MDKKEKAYLLQRIDCNCNDCGFMKRDIEVFKLYDIRQRDSQFAAYCDIRAAKIKQSSEWLHKGEKEKARVLLSEAESMRFQYQPPAVDIQYGHCQKFDKPVTFIPNTCQLETQKCFVHRKDYTHEATSSVPPEIKEA